MYTNIVQTDRKRHWANDSEDSLPSWPWFTCLSLSISKPKSTSLVSYALSNLDFQPSFQSQSLLFYAITLPCVTFQVLAFLVMTLCWQWYWHCIFCDMLLLFGDQATNSQ